MGPDVERLSAQVAQLLSEAKSLTLQEGRFTSRGIELTLEGADRRVEVRIVPKVYTAEKVIVDAINDLTIVLQVRVLEPNASGNGQPHPVFDEHVELPYSAWFEEGDFL